KLSRKQRATAGLIVMRPVLAPLFPRYLFVRFDMGRDGWREIFDYAGIGGLVCAGGLPVRVYDSYVLLFQGQGVDGSTPGKREAKLVFAFGSRVRVTEGPFAGFEASVDKRLELPIEEIDADTRIRVVVDIFGRGTPVDLNLSQIERNQPPKQPHR